MVPTAYDLRHFSPFGDSLQGSIRAARKIQKSVLKYEPKQALFGGKDGLLYIKKFLSNKGIQLSRHRLVMVAQKIPPLQ